MNLVRWDRRFPWNELEGLRKEFDRLFDTEPADQGRQLSEQSFAPATDISETDTGVLVKCNLPGVKAEELDVSVRDNLLTITGEKKGEKETKEKQYHRKETWEGRFRRSFSLSATVDQSKIDASLSDGVLTVKLPKVKATEAKKITIKS